MKKMVLLLLVLVSLVSALPAAADVVVTKGTQRFSRYENEATVWKKMNFAVKFYSVIDYDRVRFEVKNVVRIYFGKQNGAKFYSLYPTKPEDFILVDLGNGKIGATISQTLTPADPSIKIKNRGTLIGKHRDGVIKSLKGTIISHEYDESGSLRAMETDQSRAKETKQFAGAGDFSATVAAIREYLEGKGYIEIPYF